MADSKNGKQRRNQNQSHMPEDSVLYEKIVPAALIGLGVITVVLLFVAIGIATGLIPT